ncbi:uncharacterized protein TrAFT101_011943 [Trichoderma asperellum]|uniref:Uncharacterized protein n=1 Tax=Trichoderma asperellum (strain ATCC 204424 / CBS 433.97 / NBRC 101777) TaxID=1042311 RepID=A0A2T3YZF4_TRIA4|nr:hypothetical protein M441DRAFT_49434 [Trichoderma asperellum CBS 433.97]PTB37949.1 hypothetical protein M441DRAFT_49434 [Trichoderma asperellum CBS 433.97]UKZ97177.1 hypothetical protein TrAFT101_011943 [Trichoderma asperellum]
MNYYSDALALAEKGGDAKLESPNHPSSLEFEKEMLLVNIDHNHYPRRGHVRGAFIYCAVYGGLTRFIFAAVSLGKVQYADWRVASREDVTLEQISIIATSQS